MQKFIYAYLSLLIIIGSNLLFAQGNGKKDNDHLSPMTSAWNITNLCVPIEQGFDGIGSAGNANLPPGWRVSALAGNVVFSDGGTTTSLSAGTTGTGALMGTSAGGCYNFGNGVNNVTGDRAVGFLSSGTYLQPRSLFLQVSNQTGSPITKLTISFTAEKYRSGTRGFDLEFYHGADGVNWTNETTGDIYYPPNTNNSTIYNPPTNETRVVVLTGLNILPGASYFVRWEYLGSGGSTNGQAIGIDNVEVIAGDCGSDLKLKNGTNNLPCDGTLNFGTTNVGTTTSQTLTIQNSLLATIPLIIDAITLNSQSFDNGYSIANMPTLPLYLNPGESFNLIIDFNPQSGGLKPGAVTFSSNDENKNPCIINFNGSGFAPSADIFITSPANGIAFYSSYVTKIKWIENQLTGSSPIQILYAEDGINFIQVGSVPKGTGFFNWRPNFYHTTIDAQGNLNYNAVLRIKDPDSGVWSELVDVAVSMRPCNEHLLNQTIIAQNFDNQLTWGYTIQNLHPHAEMAVVSNVPYGTLSSGYSVNRTAGGTKGLIKTDNACPCKTSAENVSSSQVTFNTVDVSNYINKKIELHLASLEVADNPCNSGGACNTSGFSGSGNDKYDYVYIYISLNGGIEQLVYQGQGFSDRRFKYNDSNTPSVVILDNDGNYSVVAVENTVHSKVTIMLPDDAASVQMRVVLSNNRRSEYWAIDDISITGDELFAGEWSFARDCMLDPSIELTGNTFPSNIPVSVGNTQNEDTDVLILDNLYIQGNLSLQPNCILHGVKGAQVSIQPGNSVTAPLNIQTAFVTFPYDLDYNPNMPYGLVQEVGSTEVFYPLGIYTDLNSGCTKSYSPAGIKNSTNPLPISARMMQNTPSNYRLSTDATQNNVLENMTVDRSWLIKPLAADANIALKLYWWSSQERSGFSRQNCVIGHGLEDGLWKEELTGLFRNVSTEMYTCEATNIQSFSPFKLGSINMPFPVELISFTGEWLSPTASLLKWETGSESNSAYFSLERGISPYELQEINTQKAAGYSTQNLQYSYIDDELPAHANVFYYRLKQVDLDGSTSYSNVVQLSRNQPLNQPTVVLYPNPAKDLVTVEVAAGCRLDWFDAQGKSLNISTSNNNQFNISGIPAGIYFIRATDEKGTQRTARFIKQ